MINGNNIFATLRWSLDPSDPHFLPESDGIIANNGQDVRLSGNIVSNGVVGIFCSDRDGVALGNSASGCYLGFMLCHNPSDQVLYQISGTNVFSDTPATGWRVQNNTATGNLLGIHRDRWGK